MIGVKCQMIMRNHSEAMIENTPNNDRINAKNINIRIRARRNFDRYEMPNNDGINAEL